MIYEATKQKSDETKNRTKEQSNNFNRGCAPVENVAIMLEQT